MIRCIFFLTVLLGLAMVSVSAAATDHEAELAVVKKQFCAYQLNPPEDEQKIVPAVTNWVQSLAPDGSWKDVDYANKGRGTWLAMNHIGRLKQMCKVYVSPQYKLHGDPALSKAIHSALNFWLEKDFSNPNWWHGEIGVPRELSIILLLMGGEIAPQELEGGLKIISRSVIDSAPHGGRGRLTGQNRVWVAENVLTHGLLTSDFALVQHARDVIFEEVRITTGEGIQPDFSFFQHGPLLQLGNYGEGFAGDIVQWMTILQGTSLALDQKKTDILRDYLIKGESTVVWKGVMDISSCGRQLGAKSPRTKGYDILQFLGQAKVVDASHSADYQTAIDQHGYNAIASAIPARNTYFWRADYMVHQRPGYYISTRMNSSRVLATELVNEENLQGTYLGDGATYIYQTGYEYDGILAVWDWSRLPGVTSPQVTDKKLLRHPSATITNPSDFVGGVSDGRYGAAALVLDRDGLAAKKGWFYFDDQVACLGAGISSSDDSRLITTGVNQCLAKGDVIADEGQGKVTLPNGRKGESQLKWVWHDQVGYLFPEAQEITVGSQEQSGKWSEVNAASSPANVTVNIFSLWIDHGAKPQDAGYSYVILPGATPETLAAQSNKPDLRVLSNSAALQAVRNDKLKLTQAIFYQPGTLTYAPGKTIAVDKPCLLLLDEDKMHLTVADPTQQVAEITVTVNGITGKYSFPSGTQAGSSVTELLK